ncbi:mitochondrial carrier domain-containing protein [Russula aff. rugulosa BPL654]|nr:mitochondrial carrier domain-containing protein [Russula aff. rugulosa BPL654]
MTKIKAADQVIRSSIAGGVAACVAKTVVAPLDRVKILFQTSNHIRNMISVFKHMEWRLPRWNANIKDSSVSGLFQGHSVTLLRVFPYAAVKVMAYDQVHDLLMPTSAQEMNRLVVYSSHNLRPFLFQARAPVLPAYNTSHLRKRLTPITIRTDICIRSTYASRPLSCLSASQVFIVASQSAWPASYLTQAPHFSRGDTCAPTWSLLRWTRVTPLADLSIGALASALTQTVSYPF